MLDANDLSQIKGIVAEVVDAKLDEKLDAKLQPMKSEMMDEVKAITLASEDRIVARINREITDLATINHAVIDMVSPVPDLGRRTAVIERKLGIA